MYERLDKCPVCNSIRLENFMVVKDHSVSEESFVIAECEDCSFKFTNPRPSEEAIGKYYKSEEYISHSNTSKGLISKVYQLVRYKTLRDKLSLVNKLAKKGRLLDIGCGTGHFLQVCKKDGWKIDGVEPDSFARNLASEQTGITIGSNFLTEKYNYQFDVITMWHVLEHVHRLDSYLNKIKEILKPIGGNLIIAVPNCNSYDANAYQDKWAAYDVPRHLYHFSPDTIVTLLARYDFELIRSKGMPFDAFYVSMLSEKYKGNKINYWRALKEGKDSNEFGRRTNQYSSMIYIFKTKEAE